MCQVRDLASVDIDRLGPGIGRCSSRCWSAWQSSATIRVRCRSAIIAGAAIASGAQFATADAWRHGAPGLSGLPRGCAIARSTRLGLRLSLGRGAAPVRPRRPGAARFGAMHAGIGCRRGDEESTGATAIGASPSHGSDHLFATLQFGVAAGSGVTSISKIFSCRLTTRLQSFNLITNEGASFQHCSVSWRCICLDTEVGADWWCHPTVQGWRNESA